MSWRIAPDIWTVDATRRPGREPCGRWHTHGVARSVRAHVRSTGSAACVCGPTVACWEEPAGRLLVASGGSGVDAGRPRARCVSVRAPAASGAWANATDYSTCDVNLMMIQSKCEHRQTGAITARVASTRGREEVFNAQEECPGKLRSATQPD